MSDTFEEQIKAIEAANAHEADQMEPAEPEARPDADEEADKPDEDVLELTEGDEAVDAGEDDDGGEEHEDEDGHRRRSKPAKQRIAELTASYREQQRRADELEARLAKLEGTGDKVEEAKAPVEPKPEDFEFGESDPAYIDARQDWKLEMRDFNARQEQDEKTKETAQRDEMVRTVEEGLARAEATAKAKYEDFDAKIDEAAKARGNKPLPPIVSLATGVSPVGGDIIYRMATDPEVSDKLEKLAQGGKDTFNQFAMAFGEVEGEYTDDDSDLDMNDPADMARMMGRMKARYAGRKPAAQQAAVSATNAPEPPQGRAQGSGGRGKVSVETEDTRAFLREYGSQIGLG